MPHWLSSFTIGTHGCFFYRSEAEYLEIGAEYLRSSLIATRERTLWIVPSHFNLGRAVQELQNSLKCNLSSIQKEGRLLILPWFRWFGDGHTFEVAELIKKGNRLIEDTLKEGYQRLRVFTHALPPGSPHWDRFLQLEERMDRRLHTKPVVSLCGYRLTDCPTDTIAGIVDCHEVSVIHNGEGWAPIHRTGLLAATA